MHSGAKENNEGIGTEPLRPPMRNAPGLKRTGVHLRRLLFLALLSYGMFYFAYH